MNPSINSPESTKIPTDSFNWSDELRVQVFKNELILNDLDFFIHESIDALKNRLLLKSEQLKWQIDEATREAIENLEKYESSCKDRHHESINNNRDYKSMIAEFKRLNEAAKSFLEEKITIGSKTDERTKLSEESDDKLKVLNRKLEDLEKELLSVEFSELSKKIDNFEKDICEIIKENLKPKISIGDSCILNADLTFQFCELLKFDFKNQKLKLLYRASRDGFGAVNFHAKCDNQANTITLIRTSKNEVFGGFTQQMWSSNNQFYDDDKAYLFSLVNKFGKPFVCRIINPFKAIECTATFGPTFGTSDLYVCDNSNVESFSYSVLSNYVPPKDIGHESRNYYFCSEKNFLISELEVFQIQ